MYLSLQEDLMKKAFGILLTLIGSLSLFSCLSSSSTFGESSTSSSPDVKIYTDKFSGSKTYEYSKGLRGGFALSRNSGLSTDTLEIIPHLIVNEKNVCVPILDIKYTGASSGLLVTGANKAYKKFIFLADNERLEITPLIISNKESNTEILSSVPVTDYAQSYSLQITKKQFDTLMNYFSAHEVIECAAYSIDDKVVTFKTYNKKWHLGVFSALDNCVKNEYPNITYNETATQAIIQ